MSGRAINFFYIKKPVYIFLAFFQMQNVFSNQARLEDCDGRHLTLWEKTLKFYCDTVVHDQSVEAAMATLRDLAIDLHEGNAANIVHYKSMLRKILLSTPDLWWSIGRANQGGDVTLGQATTHLASVLDEKDALPSHPIFSWGSICQIIRYYPSHFIVFALEHLDRDTPCEAPISEELVVSAASAADKVILVYQTATHPLPVTAAVLREICVFGEWKRHLRALLPAYLAAHPDAASLIRSVMDCIPNQIQFFLDHIPLQAWRSFPHLLEGLIEHGPQDTSVLAKVITLVLQAVNTEGEDPIPRVGALAACTRLNLLRILRVILKSPTYGDGEDIEPRVLSDLFASAIRHNSHECIALLHTEYPDVQFGPQEVSALLGASRATQVMCYNEELTKDFTMAYHVDLQDLLGHLSNLFRTPSPQNHRQANLILFLCRILVKHLELHPRKMEDKHVYQVLLKGFLDREVGTTLLPRFRHLLTASNLRALASDAPFLLASLELDPPIHLWKTSKGNLVPFYLTVHQATPAPTGLHATIALDFYRHVRKAAEVLGRFDRRRIGCLWSDNPFVSRRCALESLRTYEISVYAIILHASDTSLPLVWRSNRARFLSASVSSSGSLPSAVVGRQKGDGEMPPKELIEVSMLDLDSCQAFRLVQECVGGATPSLYDPVYVEDKACGWVGSLPTSSNICLQAKGITLPPIYFVSIRPLPPSSLSWSAMMPRPSLKASLSTGPSRLSEEQGERRSPRRGQQPCTTRRY